MSQNVLERLVEGKKLPILFIGSGICKKCFRTSCR